MAYPWLISCCPGMEISQTKRTGHGFTAKKGGADASWAAVPPCVTSSLPRPAAAQPQSARNSQLPWRLPGHPTAPRAMGVLRLAISALSAAPWSDRARSASWEGQRTDPPVPFLGGRKRRSSPCRPGHGVLPSQPPLDLPCRRWSLTLTTTPMPRPSCWCMTQSPPSSTAGSSSPSNRGQSFP